MWVAGHGIHPRVLWMQELMLRDCQTRTFQVWGLYRVRMRQ